MRVMGILGSDALCVACQCVAHTRSHTVIKTCPSAAALIFLCDIFLLSDLFTKRHGLLGQSTVQVLAWRVLHVQDCPSSVAFACFSGFASCFTNTTRSVSYADWFSDPVVAETYTQAQHNGSVATGKYLIKKKLQLGDVSSMLDVGGGSGAFSYVFTEATPGLKSLILELPEVYKTSEGIRAKQSEDVQERVKYIPLDATSPDWPVDDGAFDIVLMSYISGSVLEPIIGALCANAFKALKPQGRLFVHDFMVNDALHGPALGVGDTFPLGCKFSEKFALAEFLKENPDRHHPDYSTEHEVYEPGCGLSNMTMTYGHDEYMYNVLVGNGCPIPEEGLYMIRFHSFYPWHKSRSTSGWRTRRTPRFSLGFWGSTSLTCTPSPTTCPTLRLSARTTSPSSTNTAPGKLRW